MITGVTAGILAVVVLVGAAAAGILSAVFGRGGDVCLGVVTAPGATPAGLSVEQARNAATIAQVGQELNVPVHGWIIAIATALQESNLINVDHGDRDSLGLFQQRPSQGWGTPEQILNPRHAARRFYQALLRVPGWQDMPVTEAAQRVQRSAYPKAYAKHEQRATAIVQAFTGGALPDCATVPISAHGWTRPVDGAIVSDFRTPGRPTHDGIDISAARGTVIHAASTGTVVTVLCNVAGASYPPGGGTSPCDSDGHPGLGGCGWYAEIRHPGDIVSRYCHMLARPAVRVGQTVAAGAPIGMVGTSGDSSGPHLHLEIHTGYPATSSNATPPVPFLAARGVRW